MHHTCERCAARAQHLQRLRQQLACGAYRPAADRLAAALLTRLGLGHASATSPPQPLRRR